MLKFVGDINLTDWDFNPGFGIGSKINKGFDPFNAISRNENDIWIGNFEGVASDTSIKNGYAAKVFRTKPSVLKQLCHFNIYGLANNHAMQHGELAYWNTVDALESYNCRVFGSIKEKSIVINHQNRVISLTGMCLRVDEFSDSPCYWYNPEYSEILSELGNLPQNAFKIMFVHWGNEYINRPSSAQKKYAHWLIDSGFDLIIGMHPHVLQGYEEYNGKRIYYSLGNCVFDMPSEQCKIGAIIGLEFVNGEPVYSEQYLKIDDQCCPHVVEEKEIPLQWRFGYLNECLKKEDNSESYHKEITKGYLAYRKANRKQILKSSFIHPSSFAGIFMDYVKRKMNR